MELLSTEISKLTLDAPHSMTDAEKNSLWVSIASGDFSRVHKYLQREVLPQESMTEECLELGERVCEVMMTYLPTLPQETTLKTLAEKIDMARELIRKRDFSGTSDKIVNRLVGPELFDITSPIHYREAGLRSSDKIGLRLYRYQSDDERAKNFNCDSEYKNHFELGPSLPSEKIEVQSFTEIFSSAGVAGIEVSAASTCGKRGKMEDTLIANTIQVQGKIVPFFGLFDGHGGDQLAQWVKANITAILQEHCSLPGNPLDQATAGEIENILTTLPVKVEQKLYLTMKRSGATFLLALVIGPKVFVVNAGDSRVLIVTKNKTTQLTEDASPLKQPFLDGIRKRGGQVRAEGRLQYGCCLSVARAIESEKEDDEGITPRGKVTCFDISDAEPATLILGCDGTFEASTSRSIADEYRQQGNPQALVQKAFSEGSQDNISVMVVKLHGSLPVPTYVPLPLTEPITDKQVALLPQEACLQRIQPWENPAIQDEYNIDASPIKSPSMCDPLPCDAMSSFNILTSSFPVDFGQEGVGAHHKEAQSFANLNRVFGAQNEKIYLFGSCCFSGNYFTTSTLHVFVRGIIEEEFLRLKAPLSEVNPHLIENILSTLSSRVEQRRRSFLETAPWGSDFLIGIRIKNSIWSVRTPGFGARLLVLQGENTFQMTEKGKKESFTPQKEGEFPLPYRAQVTRRVLSPDMPLTFILGSEQLFETCTSRQIADEYRKEKTPAALIQKAHTTGSGDDLTALVLEMP